MLDVLILFTVSNIGSILVFLSILFVAHYCLTGGIPKGLPPGPRPLPILGTRQILTPDPREVLCQLRRQYGDVITIYMGSRPVVFLCSDDAIKEAFIKHGHAFSGRPADMFFGLPEEMGIACSSDKTWQEQRYFTHGVLRQLGMGKSVLEQKIQEELSFFIAELGKHGGDTATNPRHTIQTSVTNIICSIMFGQRYDYDDSVFQGLLRILNYTFSRASSSGLLMTFPWLRYIPGDPWEYKEIARATEYTRQCFREHVEKHRSSYQSGVVRDFIDAYINEIDMLKDSGNTTSFSDEMLVRDIGDLFAAGSETTTTALRWMVVYMLHFPSVASQVRDEIERVIGSSRMPSMTDKPAMPYTQATILESLRFADIAPLGVPHNTTEDVQFRGYDIPKDTMVISAIYCAHRDPDVWQDPYTFKPQRFLDSDNNVIKEDGMLPFGVGRRVCLGEALARMELFLFFTTIMQRLNFSCPAGHTLPGCTGLLGSTHVPSPHQLMFELRAT